MTTYTDHPDQLFDPNRPILGSTALQTRDNLAAALEGDPSAPKLSLNALEVLSPGEVTNSTGSSIASGENNYATAASFTFLQSGTVRAQVFRTGGTNGNRRLQRRRGTVTTTLVNQKADFNTDVSVIAGDTLILSGENTTDGSSTSYTARIKTDGSVRIWPGGATPNVINNV